MKKTDKTALTAALFAAAMNIIPSGTFNTTAAGEVTDESKTEITAYDNGDLIINEPIATYAPVYGPPFIATTTTEVPEPTCWNTQAVYGPPIAWKGDLDMDGVVDVFDMVQLRNSLVKIQGKSGDTDYNYAADINDDGIIGMADLVMLQQFLLGKIDNFNEKLPEPEETTIVQTEIPAPVYGPPSWFGLE